MQYEAKIRKKMKIEVMWVKENPGYKMLFFSLEFAALSLLSRPVVSSHFLFGVFLPVLRSTACCWFPLAIDQGFESSC